jgi:hypothetical protein
MADLSCSRARTIMMPNAEVRMPDAGDDERVEQAARGWEIGGIGTPE